MDMIVSNYFESFLSEFNIEGGNTEKNFEKFINYVVMYPKNIRNFHLSGFCVGDGADTGIDGIGISMNNRFVSTLTEVTEILQTGMEFDLEIFFIQTKTTESFECKEIRSFVAGVCDLFKQEDEISLLRNDRIKDYKLILDLILDNFAYAKSKKCYVYYITPGVYLEDQNQKATVQDCKNMLLDLDLFENGIKINIKGKDFIRKQFESTKIQNSATFTMLNKIDIPYIPHVEDAYFTTMPIKDYLEIVVDDEGKLRRGIFDLNVRDFAGIDDNPVNQDVENTLSSNDKNMFGLLNNGVTIVGRNISKGQGKYTIKNFYIVNGCQTTNILFNNREKVDDSMWISIKIVITNNDGIIENIVKATNNQTEVKKIQFQSREEYQKLLESYYNSRTNKYNKLYYERREGQYRSDYNISPTQIISFDKQMRAFASVFLEMPHISSRFVGKLEEDLNKKIFVNGHKASIYYTAALINNMLEDALRNEKIHSKYNKLQYHIDLIIFKLASENQKVPRNNSNKIDVFCEHVIEKVVANFDELLESSIELLECNVDINNVDANKKQNTVNRILRYIDIGLTEEELALSKYYSNSIEERLIPFKNMLVDGDLRYNFEKNLKELLNLLSVCNYQKLQLEINQLTEGEEFLEREERKGLSKDIYEMLLLFNKDTLDKIERSRKYDVS